jgi:prepilin-type N-terminal cleavage/methylation domain-containing protein
MIYADTMKRNGFSLIELLVVIAIIATLVALAIPNYVSARQRAQDVKIKSEMTALKDALRLYYNDFETYPADVGPLHASLNGCGAGGTSVCPCVSGGTSIDFATGASCDVVYMKHFPAGFGLSASSKTIFYYLESAGNDFCLVGTLSNKSDPDIAVSQARCASVCGVSCSSSATHYCVCAD